MSGSQVLAVRAEWKKRDIVEVLAVRYIHMHKPELEGQYLFVK
jgi:hypothetical protein